MPDIPQLPGKLEIGGVEAVLAEDRFLRSLASSLLADRDEAEDAVQHAWLRGLLYPPAKSGARRSFLARILRNRLHNVRRDKRRRVRHERAAARPEALPSTAEMAAREELARRVGEAVLALEEPYRTTIWLRFKEELPPREVAARMGVPVETVRTRLRRALERMRERLDSEYGSRRAWMPLMPTSGFRGARIAVALAGALVCAVGYALWSTSSNDMAAGALPPESVTTAAIHPSAETPAANEPSTRERVASAPASSTPDADSPFDSGIIPPPRPETEAEREFFIERAVLPRFQGWTESGLRESQRLISDVPATVRGADRARLEELATRVGQLRAESATYLIPALVDYIRAYPHLHGPPVNTPGVAAGTLSWNAAEDSPWPAGTRVWVGYVIPWGEYPKLDSLKREETRTRDAFKKLLAEARIR